MRHVDWLPPTGALTRFPSKPRTLVWGPVLQPLSTRARAPSVSKTSLDPASISQAGTELSQALEVTALLLQPPVGSAGRGTRVGAPGQSTAAVGLPGSLPPQAEPAAPSLSFPTSRDCWALSLSRKRSSVIGPGPAGGPGWMRAFLSSVFLDLQPPGQECPRGPSHVTGPVA